MSGCMHIEYKTIQFYVISGPTKEADSLHGLVTLSTVGVLYSSRQSSMGYKMSHYGQCCWGRQKYARGYAHEHKLRGFDDHPFQECKVPRCNESPASMRVCPQLKQVSLS